MSDEEKTNSATAAPIRERWLNGWRRSGPSVLMGTAYHCAGCGAFLGLGCVAFDGTPWPEKEPDFPFDEATCPLCQLRRMPDPPDRVDKLTERLERLKKRDSVAVGEAQARMAIAIDRSNALEAENARLRKVADAATGHAILIGVARSLSHLERTFLAPLINQLIEDEEAAVREYRAVAEKGNL